MVCVRLAVGEPGADLVGAAQEPERALLDAREEDGEEAHDERYDEHTAGGAVGGGEGREREGRDSGLGEESALVVGSRQVVSLV